MYFDALVSRGPALVAAVVMSGCGLQSMGVRESGDQQQVTGAFTVATPPSTTNSKEAKLADVTGASGGGAAKLSEADDQTDEAGTGAQTKTSGAVASSAHPLAHLTDAELERRLLEDKASLGPVSLGQADAGLLWNGVKMPEGERWELVDPPRTWATPETIDSLIAAIDKVHEEFPNTPKLYVGDLSREGGGRFGKHLSHRSGRDVDLGFYYKDRFTPWYREATEANLDIPRTWALIRALVTETDLELILVDSSLHWPLRSYAQSIGEDPAWLRSLFVRSSPPEERLPIQHRDGHKTHFHVRFYNPIAQETGQRIYPLAIKNELIKERHYYVRAFARRDDTLDSFLKRYRTSLPSLRRANGPRANRFRPGSFYKILRFGPVDPGEEPAVIPPRLIPPAKQGGT